MKKVLFATSALVLSAGFASAEVAVSGDGRMGMIYDGNDVQFSSRARVKFTLTGESDAGLSFGGSFRVDQQDDAGGKASNGTAGEVWISGTYGRLAMGDVVSASEAAIGDLYEVGYTEGGFAGDIEEITYLTGDNADLFGQGPNALYEYGVDGITFFASTSDGKNEAGEGDVAYSLAAKYEAGNYSAGLGYAKFGDASEISLGAEATFDQFSVKGIYVKYDDADAAFAFARGGVGGDWEDQAGIATHEHTIGLAAAYQADAILVKGFWRQDKFEAVATGATAKFDSFGIGADYDLGGGAVLAGGIIDSDYLDDTVADLGVKFKF